MTSSSRWCTSLSMAAADVRLMRVEIGLGRLGVRPDAAGRDRLKCAGFEPMVGLLSRLRCGRPSSVLQHWRGPLLPGLLTQSGAPHASTARYFLAINLLGYS